MIALSEIGLESDGKPVGDAREVHTAPSISAVSKSKEVI